MCMSLIMKVSESVKQYRSHYVVRILLGSELSSALIDQTEIVRGHVAYHPTYSLSGSDPLHLLDCWQCG